MIIKRFIIALSLLLVFMIPAFASSYVDNFTKDEQIKTALELLQTYNAQEIFDNLEENSVKIKFYDLSQIGFDFGNHFAINSLDTMGNRYILINSKYRNVSPEELACIIAHESFHKLTIATLEEETLATEKEAYYWSILKDPAKEYEYSALLRRLDGLVELREASNEYCNLIKEKIVRNSFYKEQLAIGY